MLPVPEPARTGEKRGPGRPLKTATPAAKKQRLSTTTTPSYTTPTSTPTAGDSPAPETKASRLPAKVVENCPLPSLSEPQSVSLPDDEYRSIAASAVLSASIERSRSRWVHDGIFKKYWIKPEAGKNARPPPPGNPDAKCMKNKGECRIRLEPHILTADVYVEDRAKLTIPPKQQQYGPQPYRPLQQQQQHPQGRQLQTSPPNNSQSRPPLQPAPALTSQQQQRTPYYQQSQKQQPQVDPVIGMLANRASTDPELKSLMKQVATGSATQDQLRIFQQHIDELTAFIQKQHKEEDGQGSQAVQQSDSIQYDGPADVKPPVKQQAKPTQMPHPVLQEVPSPYTQTQPLAQQRQQQQPPPPPVWSSPPPTSQPVILSFKDPGASEDRFLFPQYAIFEHISPHHLLLSFMVTKKGREAVDTSGLEPDTEYWQPVTIMIEVMYGKEEILESIKKWVKPADEVRAHMVDVMKRCERAPLSYLALRLPFKGAASSLLGSEMASQEATPVLEERIKSKPGPKPKPKVALSSSKAATDTKKELPQISNTAVPTEAAKDATPIMTDNKVSTDAVTHDGGAVLETPEVGRPKRAVRKSVRISEV